MIELRGISKRFGDVRAVDGVSLSIASGEFLTLLGPSGCGKTTLLRMIAGFERPDDGRVLLDGTDVTDHPPYRRNVNQVFQSYALFPHLNVWKNIAFGLKMKRLGKSEIHRRVTEVLEMVELTGMEKRRPDQLSGGQRQRVALARAAVNRPKVLLLDEPLAALDAKLRQAMQMELKRLQQRLGITFVFVTHDQSEALVMSDRVVVMNQGKVEQSGTPMEVYHQPASEFVGRFVGVANLWEGNVVNGGLRIGDLELPIEGNGRVKVMVRPEKIKIASQGVDAQIKEIHFMGAMTQLILLTRAGIEITATIGGDGQWTRDQWVKCSIAAGDVLVL